MDNRPIGFFDSGIGGLTSVLQMKEKLPKESIIFFGDTARTPYGSKSVETIRQFTIQIGEFLRTQDVKMIVIACNTVSATALETLREKYPDITIIGVISPTAKQIAKNYTGEDRIGVIATKVTVNSGVYEKKILKDNGELKVFSKACPAFVPLIEEGIIDNEIMDLTIRYYLDDFIRENNINTLVLGCTHYPLIAHRIKKIYPNLEIVSSSAEVVTAVEMELEKKNQKSDYKKFEDMFYASDLSSGFNQMIELILGKSKDELNIKFKNLDL